ncbi:MAG: START-like domain-containing protein [Prevotella sp.]|jgi:hypothetical protein
MEKKKLTIEYELHSRSKSIIWNLISSGEGLSRWMADEVKDNNGQLTVTWGSPMGEKEVRHAQVLERDKYRAFRFRWSEDEGNDDYFVELRVNHDALTDTYMLVVTDFVEPDDEDSMTHIWNHDREKLLRRTGV